MVKQIGLFGFFLLMLMVALLTTGVWQQGILPRLKGMGGRTAPHVAVASSEAPRPAGSANPPQPQESPEPPTPRESEAEEDRRLKELEERLKREREILTTEGRRLMQLKATIEKLLQEEQAKEEARLQHLAKLYERMKPKEAAAAVEKMDRAFAARLLSLMGERPAAKILEALDSPIAADLSRRMSDLKEGTGRAL